ncbi:DNA replication protein psf2 [Malassezia equina]|uniref:DNA replication complex GINS protein PSF2 n=1 Tax=Malassezia equina TaxID=1381935 RepID=A0AAF0EBX3_9BASI|nr:DNA replication protein psf2 [Malassezia equina]
MEYVASSETLVNILPLVSLDRWLSVDALTEYLRQETSTLPFSPLPLHFMAISKLLLEHAAEDIPSSSKIRSLLKDLREARQSKILAGLGMINGAHLEMTNISSMEICELRPFFRTALTQLHALQTPTEPKEEPATQEDEDDITVRRH